MALVYVSYDLDKPGQNYQDLWDELESLGAKRVQDSVWVLRSDDTAEALFNILQRHIDKNDRLLVIKSSSSYWIRPMNDPKKV